MFLYLFRCSAVIIMILFLEDRGDLMAYGKDLRGIDGPFEIVFVSIRQRFRTVQRDIGQLRKGLELLYE